MGFLGQAYMTENHGPNIDHRVHAKRRRTSTSDKFAFLKRTKQQIWTRYAQDPAAKNGAFRFERLESDLQVQQDDEVMEEDFGDIPRSIYMTLDDHQKLFLPLLLSPAPSFDSDSIGSPCVMMYNRLALQSGEAVDDGTEILAELQTINTQHLDPSLFDHNQEVNDEEENHLDSIISSCEQTQKEVAKLRSIMKQTPSLDYLPQYIAALSRTVSPKPTADLPSRALRFLFSLSEHSSHKHHRINMVRHAASASDIDDDNKKNTTLLIPALLAFLRRCPRNSSVQHLALLILNNLSIPTENKRLIALDYGGAKILGRLLNKDPGCQMLVIIIVNLAFGDESCPLVDPKDPITRRNLGRVVSFLEIWKEQGLPLDFRHLYGVKTGLCV